MTKSILIVAVNLLFTLAVAAQVAPKVETFFGYTYTRANSASNVPNFSANGGGGQLAVNFNKWAGFVMDLGAVHNGNLNGKHFDTTVSNFLFGPRFSIRRSRVTPYFHLLFGGAHFGTSTAIGLQTPVLPLQPSQPIFVPGQGLLPVGPGQPVTGRLQASQTAFGMATGFGLDIKISRWVSFRPIGLDYYLTRLQNMRTLNDNNQHNLRYTMGFNFTFGAERPAAPPPPPPPVTTKACPGGITIPMEQDCPKRDINMALKVDPGTVCAGATVMITPTAVLPTGTASHWSVNGEPGTSEATAFEFRTAGRAPGTYKIGLKVTGEGYNDASAEGEVIVSGYQPPAGTLEASPSEIFAGEKATLAPNFRSGQCGGNLRPPEFSVTEGAVAGNQFDSTTVQFDPANNAEQRKTITVSAKVSDDGGSGAAQASIVVKKKAAIMAKRLPDIVFPVGSERVNNCGKRVLLEELKALTSSDPTGTVYFVGHQTDNEAKWPGLDQKRALNAAAVISAGQGICTNFPGNQIQVSGMGSSQSGVDPQPHFCGTSADPEKPGQSVRESDEAAKYRRVEVWFVPTGGVVPPSVSNYKDAATLSVSALGCPR